MQKVDVRKSSRLKRSTTTDVSFLDTDVSATPTSNIDSEKSNADTASCRFHCTFCSKSFSRMDNLQVHKRSIHGKVKMKCLTCKKCFSSQLALDRHEVTHSDRRLHQCTVCDMTFNRADAMKTHQREVHQCDSESPFMCEFYWCSKKFYTKVALERHVKVHNSTSKHWSIIKHCDDCLSRKETPSHQILLSETSEWLWHQCSLCLKTFKDCRSLQLHTSASFNLTVKRTHNNCSHGKQIIKIGAQCMICWKLFGSKQGLKKHKQSQHTVPSVLFLKKLKPKIQGHWTLSDEGWKWKPLDPGVDPTSLTTREEEFLAYHRRLANRQGRMNTQCSVVSPSVVSSSVTSKCVVSASIVSSSVASTSGALTSVGSNSVV